MNIDLIPDPATPLATATVQAALDRVHEAGGGRVTLDAGRWVSGTIFLRSFTELHLARGCRLIASHNLGDYTPIDARASNKDQTPFHLIVCDGIEHAAITGPGVINGQDTAFWDPCEGEHDRPYGIFRFKIRVADHELRPSPLIQIVRSRDVGIADLTIERAPGWTLHLFDCDRVLVHAVTIRNHRFGPNTDGVVVNGSRNVRVAHCDIDAGDDAFIIKATEPDSRCERVTVTNCVASSNCSAFGVGADIAGRVRDIVFSNCVADRSLRLIQIEMWFAGTVEGVVFENIVGKTKPDPGVTCERPIYLDIQQWTRKEGALGSVRDVVIRNVRCETRGRIVMTAQDGSRIDNVTLEHVQLRVPEIEDPAQAVPAATSMQLSNFNPHTRAARAAIVADNVVDLLVRDVRVDWPADDPTPMHAMCRRRCENVRLESPMLRPSRPDLAAEVSAQRD